MKVLTAYSTKSNEKEALKEIEGTFSSINATLVLYFASVKYDHEEICKGMKKAFPSAHVIGCSSAGEITKGKMMEHSIVAMAFSKEIVGEFKVEIVQNLKEKETKEIESAFQSFETHFGVHPKEMDYKKYVGMVLFEANALAEEWVMDKIGDLTNVIFIGGTAGDDCRFEQTYLYADGQVYTDSVLLLLMKPETTFDFIKTQSFTALHQTMVATKVEEEKRRVVEFDGKPAVHRYEELFENKPNQIKDLFFTNPLGLIVENEIFVRSPYNIVEGTKIDFYCNILEGMEVTLLQSKNIIEDTKKAILEKEKELGGISAIIDFQCILRALELRNKNQTDAYGNLFKNIETIGFATYGEEFIGHINQTSTMLVFK